MVRLRQTYHSACCTCSCCIYYAKERRRQQRQILQVPPLVVGLLILLSFGSTPTVVDSICSTDTNTGQDVRTTSSTTTGRKQVATIVRKTKQQKHHKKKYHHNLSNQTYANQQQQQQQQQEEEVEEEGLLQAEQQYDVLPGTDADGDSDGTHTQVDMKVIDVGDNDIIKEDPVGPQQQVVVVLTVPNQSNRTKSECITGLHNVATTNVSIAPERFIVRWMTTITTSSNRRRTVDDDEDKDTIDKDTNNNNDDDDNVIEVEIIRQWSPLGVDRFYNLVVDNYYNCAAFFRVVNDFVVQFGIASEPIETKKWDITISDDPIHIQSNTIGTITFATAGPQTRTTQLFINTKNNPNLDGQGFTPFGTVTKGLKLLTTYVTNPTPYSSDGVDQDLYTDNGNEWILENYPDIDIITNTVLVQSDDR